MIGTCFIHTEYFGYNFSNTGTLSPGGHKECLTVGDEGDGVDDFLLDLNRPSTLLVYAVQHILHYRANFAIIEDVCKKIYSFYNC